MSHKEMNELLEKYEEKLIEIFVKEIGNDDFFYIPYTDGFEIKCTVKLKYKFNESIILIYEETSHMRAREVGFDCFNKWHEHIQNVKIRIRVGKRGFRLNKINTSLPDKYIDIICDHGDVILKKLSPELQLIKKKRKNENIKREAKDKENQKRINKCQNKLKNILGIE